MSERIRDGALRNGALRNGAACEPAPLNSADQEALAGLARAAIESAVTGEAGPSGELTAQVCREHPALARPAGAFVTVYVAGELRGCLGEIEPDEALGRVVVRCAGKVPVSDYRFAAVIPEELRDLTFKISVLSPSRPIQSAQEVKIGRDGLIARHEGRLGLLLPDVPLEYGWDVPTFITHLWKKAGISPAVPIAAVRLQAFSTQIVQSIDYIKVMPD